MLRVRGAGGGILNEQRRNHFHESMVRRYHSRRSVHCERDDGRGHGAAGAYCIADGIRVADADDDDAALTSMAFAGRCR